MDLKHAAGFWLLCDTTWNTLDARAQTRVFTVEELDELADFPWSRPRWRWPSALCAFVASLPRWIRPISPSQGSGFPSPGRESASSG